MTDDGKFDLEPFWDLGLKQLWITLIERDGGTVPDDIDAQLRELFAEYPPIKTETGWNVVPLIYGLARKTGEDPDALLAVFSKSQQEQSAARADAVEAAEDLLRGER